MSDEKAIAMQEQGQSVTIQFKNEAYTPATIGALTYNLTPVCLVSNYSQTRDASSLGKFEETIPLELKTLLQGTGESEDVIEYPGDPQERYYIRCKGSPIDVSETYKLSLLGSENLISDIEVIINRADSLEYAMLTICEAPDLMIEREKGFLEIYLEASRFDALHQKISNNENLEINVKIKLLYLSQIWTTYAYAEHDDYQRLVYIDDSELHIPKELKGFFSEQVFRTKLSPFELSIKEFF